MSATAPVSKMTSTAEVPPALPQARSAEPRVPLLVRGWHAVTFAVRALGDAFGAFRRARRRERVALALLLLRMRAKQFVMKLSPSRKFQSETVFCWTLQCLDYNSFAFFVEEVFVRGDYEFCSRAEKPLILDCGSNIGLALFFFKHRYPQARIVAFEACRVAFEKLTENVKVNRLQDVKLHHVALSSSSGLAEFYEDSAAPGSGKNSLFPGRGGDRLQVVPIAPLSQFIEEPVDLLKLDIEGAEETVLAELVASGRLALVRQLVMEYHHHILPGQDRLSHTLRILEENGFGYEFRETPPPASPGGFQDLLIHAYRK